jgi:hypothetical protein
MYRDFLVSCMRGENEIAFARFDQVRSLRAPELDPAQIVAAIAAKKANGDLLKFAFARGAEMNRDVAVSVKRIVRNAPDGGGDYFKELLPRALEVCPLDERTVQRKTGFDPGDRFDDINW